MQGIVDGRSILAGVQADKNGGLIVSMYDNSNGELIQEKKLDAFQNDSLAKEYQAQLYIQEDNLKLYEIFTEVTKDSEKKRKC